MTAGKKDPSEKESWELYFLSGNVGEVIQGFIGTTPGKYEIGGLTTNKTLNLG